MNDNITLTIRQIAMMQHAIGLTHEERIKRGKIKIRRNYYDAGAADFAWDVLVAQGFAEKKADERGVCYKVTPEGIKLLERIMLIKTKGD